MAEQPIEPTTFLKFAKPALAATCPGVLGPARRVNSLSGSICRGDGHRSTPPASPV